MIELVVFDMAGTTIHDGDAVNASFRATLAAWGLEAHPAIINTVMGLPKPEAIRILLEQFGAARGIAPTPANVDAIHVDFTRRMCEYYANDPSVREIAGAAALIARLRQAGIKVALNTGFFRPIVDVLLRRLGWTVPDVIDAVITSDEAPRGRPYPDMILALMARFGVQDPRRVAKVGDTKADLEEGSNAGCGLVIGVTSGAYTREELARHPHTHIVASITEAGPLLLERH